MASAAGWRCGSYVNEKNVIMKNAAVLSYPPTRGGGVRRRKYE